MEVIYSSSDQDYDSGTRGHDRQWQRSERDLGISSGQKQCVGLEYFHVTSVVRELKDVFQPKQR